MADRLQHALVRELGDSFANGLTAADLGEPDLALARRQHAAYRDALGQAGLAVTVLPADENHPDGVFVEDTAVVTPEIAVIARPGAPSRDGEQRAVEQALAADKTIARIESPGALDGGDVLRVGRRVFVGLSERTNQAGADQLADALGPFAYTVETIVVPDLLHLKTGNTALDDRTLIATPALAGHPAFADYEILTVDADEGYAANCLRVNDSLLVPQECPATVERLGQAGYAVVALAMSEFRKMDGGLTCLSILW
ncbi:MAG: dimethylarginine dimethylaminohydrolase family protein [Planctomycetota bacterium]|jgi:dimethylargininase